MGTIGKIAITASWTFCCMAAKAQGGIGIGTNTPHASAALEISSSNKGILVPRMSQSARLAIASPANGLLVYDSTSHRLFQYQEGEWRYMLTNAQWVQSASRNWTYNSSDSVGIGTASPTARLDVQGNIQSRENIVADGGIEAGGNISSSTLVATSLLNAGGSLSMNGPVNSSGDMLLNTAGATVQLQNNSGKKAFFQVSGNDLRIGTNSGNSAGKLIMRMNGVDAIAIDRFGNVNMLQTSANEGRLMVNAKVVRRAAPTVNMLPIIFGYIPADAAPEAWMSPIYGSWDRISAGTYEITNLSAPGLSPFSAIIVTPVQSGYTATASYISTTKIKIETFNRNGTRADSAFFFVVNSPIN